MSLVGIHVNGQTVREALIIMLTDKDQIAFDFNGSSQVRSLALLDRARTQLGDLVLIDRLLRALEATPGAAPLVQPADATDLRRATDNGGRGGLVGP